MKRILLIDNYDSFTYNLLHYLGELGAKVEVARNDKVPGVRNAALSDTRPLSPETWDGIVISPGPGAPEDAGLCPQIIRDFGDKVPILGVCLGHQAIGMVYGGKVIRHTPMHGKTSVIQHTGEGVFKHIPNPFTATRYHSLIVERESLPACLKITAETEDGVIMGLQHTAYPVHGVQFHPESIASEHGHQLMKNFLDSTQQK